MLYSDKNLEDIGKLASVFLPISDIAVIVGVPADVLREDIAVRSSEVSKAYFRGKAASKLLLRQQEMMLAQRGAPLAIQNVRDSLLDMEDDE